MAPMRKRILKRLRFAKEAGCGLLTVLFITLPIWVMTAAWRGPVYAVVSLAVLLLLVFAVAALSRAVDR